MSYYDEVYLRRLNRYGLDYQSRIQGQRERNFENYLLKTLYRVDFEYGDKVHPASLERYKQDYSETQGYLLTRIDLKIPNGTILDIISQDGTSHPWMIWWLEQIEASGYNRYVVLKMTHTLTWTAAGQNYSQWGYFSGPGTKAIKDAIKSSTGKTVYDENDNLHMYITPYHAALTKEVYFEATQEDTTQGYKISDIDIVSTPGVAYVSVDPTLLRSHVDPPVQEEGQPDEEYYWLNGGDNGNT